MDSGGKLAIVGAGAWGLSCALSLLEQGASQVHVFERLGPGSGSTALAAGLVSTHLRQEADIRLVLRTRRMLKALQDWGAYQGRPSAQFVYNPVGSVTLVAQEAADKLERLRERVRTAGGAAEFLEPQEVAARWPLQQLQDLAALYTADDGHVEGGDLVDLLQARVRDLGGRVVTERLASLERTGQSVVGVQTLDGTHRFDEVIVAAGAWTKALLARSDLPVPLKPYRTQLAQLGYEHEGRFPILHDASLRVYARPDGANAILVGDGTELVESDPETFVKTADGAFVEKVAAAAATRVRDGGAASYRHGWAGLCVCTPDRDPLIGPYPGVQGLHVMGGDNGFGVMRSLALGEVAARGILKGVAAREYDPSRLSMTAPFEVREGFEL